MACPYSKHNTSYVNILAQSDCENADRIANIILAVGTHGWCVWWAMRDRWVGNIGDFGKLALLRHLMGGRRLAICWYLTGQRSDALGHDRHFAYLERPDEFRHFAPEIYDALKGIVRRAPTDLRRISVLETSGLLEGVVFHGTAVPKRVPLRKPWTDMLVRS